MLKKIKFKFKFKFNNTAGASQSTFSTSTPFMQKLAAAPRQSMKHYFCHLQRPQKPASGDATLSCQRDNEDGYLARARHAEKTLTDRSGSRFFCIPGMAVAECTLVTYVVHSFQTSWQASWGGNKGGEWWTGRPITCPAVARPTADKKSTTDTIARAHGPSTSIECSPIIGSDAYVERGACPSNWLAACQQRFNGHSAIGQAAALHGSSWPGWRHVVTIHQRWLGPHNCHVQPTGSPHSLVVETKAGYIFSFTISKVL